MRKFIFFPLLACLLLLSAFVLPISAETSDPAFELAYKAEDDNDDDSFLRTESELVIKVEAAPNGQINADGKAGDRIFNDGIVYGDKAGLAFSAEYYYYWLKFLGAGIGFKYGLERNFDNFGSISVIDAYIALKPKLKIIPTNRPNDKEAVYLILQGGYGFFNKELTLRNVSGNIISSKTEADWYYAAGFGAEFNGIIFEVLFAVNELNVSAAGGSPVDLDARYSMTNINIGYKFGFNEEDK